MSGNFLNHKGVIWVAIKNCTKDVINSREFIESQPFEVPVGKENTKWCVGLFPKSLETPSYMNLNFFRGDDLKLQFTIHCTFYIIGKTRKYVKNSIHSCSEESNGFSFGCKPFLSHAMFAKFYDELVQDGNVKIGCEVTISSVDPDVKSSSSRVSDDVQRMFEEELFADFELSCNDGVKLKCHKVILAARSPVFRAMLSNDMKETQEGLAEIQDFDSAVMKEVLRFIYCDRVENLDEISKKLIFAADYYDLEVLKEKCIRNILLNISEENVIEVLLITEKVSGCEKLFNECAMVVGRNLLEISKSRYWENLSKDMVTKILIDLQEPLKFELIE